MYRKHCAFGTYKWPEPATIERYLLAAARAGLTEARYSLATFYWFNDPQYKDGVSKGIAYFSDGAPERDALGEAFMARAYECGRGVGRDQAKAANYYSAVSRDSGNVGVEHGDLHVDLHEVALAGLLRLTLWTNSWAPEGERFEIDCLRLWDTMEHY
jgi:hypothetical protein